MNKQYHLSKEWLIKKRFFIYTHDYICVTGWLPMVPQRFFELTDTAIKFRNGSLVQSIIERGK